MKKAAFLSLIVCLSFPIQAQNLAGKWIFMKSKTADFEQLWLNEHKVPALDGGTAYITAETSNPSAEYKIVSSQMPCLEGMRRGDSWTFHIPVKHFKGGYVETDLVLGTKPSSPKYFIVEYLDGKEWKISRSDLHPVPENPALSYNVKCTGDDHYHCSVTQTLLFTKPVRNGELLVRLRAVGDYACNGGSTLAPDSETGVRILTYGYIGAYARLAGTQAPKDTTKIGWLGNSFTFVNAADFILKELAFCEGHYLDLRVGTYPGARFRSHLSFTKSLDYITEGGYDYVILQDQSTQAARYGRDKQKDVMDYTKTLGDVIKYFTPDVKLIYEKTWAFSQDNFGSFGSYEAFDSCATAGAGELAAKIGATVSPIADAFALVRAERPDIVVYSTDDHHPANYGAYLKACVNYLTIFKTPFTAKADFGLDPQTCAYLREVAQRVVLKVKLAR